MPYQFFPTGRRCSNCKQRLLTATPLTPQFTQGLLQKMGITCWCVQCSRRYRATSPLPYVWICWAGPLGRWAWWKAVTLEEITESYL